MGIKKLESNIKDDQNKAQIKQRRSKKIVHLSNEQVAHLSHILYQQFKKEERAVKYAPVKEVLSLLGKGLLLTTLFMVPNAGRAMKPLLQEESDWDAWKRYNPCYLKGTIKRLEKLKDVRLKKIGDQMVVVLTDKGKRRILKYALDELKIKKPRFWDGKWRLVVYDLPVAYKGEREFLRETLIRLGFYKFQESVYIYPYECQDEIEYLRSFLAAREHIRILIVDQIENDQAFRTYFDLD
jgi:CRISPR-associated endonuclease Cas2